MYTILYFAKDGSDRWERFESAEELIAFLQENDLMDDGDLQIYGLGIDDFLLSVSDVQEKCAGKS